MNVSDLYNIWRKQTLPASINEVEWRHNELRARLEQIQNDVNTNHFFKQKYAPQLHQSVIQFFKLFRPVKVEGFEKIRVGSEFDGGYIQLNDLSRAQKALSLGINDDDNWDYEIAKHGIRVDQYDHTIESAPTKHDNLYFHKKQIAAKSSLNAITLSDLLSAEDAPRSPHILLKMDIEGDEWNVIDATSESDLNSCSQIICEFHNLSQLDSTGFYALAHKVIQKLTNKFAVFHIHGNNSAPVYNLANILVPDVIEVSFANRDIYKFSETSEIFPTQLDSPCNKNMPDIFLGTFRFD
jgi:FkbM family methyltransferase